MAPQTNSQGSAALIRAGGVWYRGDWATESKEALTRQHTADAGAHATTQSLQGRHQLSNGVRPRVHSGQRAARADDGGEQHRHKGRATRALDGGADLRGGGAQA